MQPSTIYYLAVYEYDCTSGRYYLSPAGTSSFTTDAPCLGNATANSITSVTSNRNTAALQISALGAGSNGTGVVLNTSSVFTPQVNGVNPTANTTYSSGEQIVYNADATGNVTITGLAATTTYYVAVYDYKCVDDRNYNTSPTNYSFTTLANPPEGLQITAVNQLFTIDFDNTVAGVNDGKFAGNDRGTGSLETTSWMIFHNQNPSINDLEFRNSFSSSVTFRGSSNFSVSSNGIYAFNYPNGNSMLGVQPAASFFTNGGAIVLKIQNNSRVNLEKLNLSYDLFFNNDQGKASIVKFYYATSTVDFIEIPSVLVRSPSTEGSAGNQIKVNFLSSILIFQLILFQMVNSFILNGTLMKTQVLAYEMK